MWWPACPPAEAGALRAKTSELEQTIEILKVAMSFFAPKRDPRH